MSGRGYIAEELGLADVSASQQRGPAVRKKKKRPVKKAAAAAPATRSGLTWEGFINQAVWRVQQRLQGESCSQGFIDQIIPILSAQKYAETVEERSAMLRCGFPLCGMKIKSFDMEDKTYRVDMDDRAIYETTSQKLFCSRDCHRSSSHLASTLPTHNIVASADPTAAALLKLFPQLTLEDLRAINPRVSASAASAASAPTQAAGGLPLGVVIASGQPTPFKSGVVQAEGGAAGQGEASAKEAKAAAVTRIEELKRKKAQQKEKEKEKEAPAGPKRVSFADTESQGEGGVAPEAAPAAPAVPAAPAAVSPEAAPTEEEVATGTASVPHDSGATTTAAAAPPASRPARRVVRRARSAAAQPDLDLWEEHRVAEVQRSREEAGLAPTGDGDADEAEEGEGEGEEEEEEVLSGSDLESEESEIQLVFATLPVYCQAYEVLDGWVSGATRLRLRDPDVVVHAAPIGEAVPEDGEDEGALGVNTGDEADSVSRNLLAAQQLEACVSSVFTLLSRTSLCRTTLGKWLAQVFSTLSPTGKVVVLSRPAATVAVLLLVLRQHPACRPSAEQYFEAVGLHPDQVAELSQLLD